MKPIRILTISVGAALAGLGTALILHQPGAVPIFIGAALMLIGLFLGD
jgi:hypothetical protein